MVGQLAQKRGAENAGRLVSSAKSWLSHGGVDRTSALLPITAPEGVGKISPLAASRAYLEHIRDAWNQSIPTTPFDKQHVLVTVPASFDAVARELTLHAAEEAGYKNIILLEEPQAAFYAWIERHPNWREQVAVGDLILVVDIGGGTTDFTLIAVTEEGGELRLERVAVGEHILLGGDNMDLALARTVEAQLAQKNTKLDAMQLNALWQQCRSQRNACSQPDSNEAEHPVTILGRGTGLVGGTIKAQSDPRRSQARAARRLLPQWCRARTCRRRGGASACRKSACLTPPMPRSRVTSRTSSRQQGSELRRADAHPVQRRRPPRRHCPRSHPRNAESVA